LDNRVADQTKAYILQEPKMSVASISEAVAIGFASQCDRGKVREENQDTVLRTSVPLGDLLVVADGIGGFEGGGVASRMAVEAISSSLSDMPTFFPPAIAIQEATSRANAEIVAAAAEPDTPNNHMGTTVVLALLQEDPDHPGTPVQAWIGHIGDSRAYLVHQGRLACITRDHSAVQLLLDHNLIAPEEVHNHPDASILTRTLGQELNVEIELDAVALGPGDTLLLCSDGLWGYVSDREIERVLTDPALSAEGASRALLDLALEAGGHDNVGIQIARLGGTSESARADVRASAPAAESQSTLERALASFSALERSNAPAPEPESAHAAAAEFSPPSVSPADPRERVLASLSALELRSVSVPEPEPAPEAELKFPPLPLSIIDRVSEEESRSHRPVDLPIYHAPAPEPASAAAAEPAQLPASIPTRASVLVFPSAPLSAPRADRNPSSAASPSESPQGRESAPAAALESNSTLEFAASEPRISTLFQIAASLWFLFAYPLERESEFVPVRRHRLAPGFVFPDPRPSVFPRLLAKFLIALASQLKRESEWVRMHESDFIAEFQELGPQVSTVLKLIGILLLAFGTSCGLVYFAVLQNWFGVTNLLH
jgi:PPM family protein phosphatase